jgi:hypothetical protein
MSALDPNQIAALLKEEALAPTTASGTRRVRGPKVDLTAIREINIWMKLPHHICMPDCEHRTLEGNKSEGKACWNPNCVDPRPPTDRGSNIVAQVRGQYVCRYCFLGGWLS